LGVIVVLAWQNFRNGGEEARVKKTRDEKTRAKKASDWKLWCLGAGAIGEAGI